MEHLPQFSTKSPMQCVLGQDGWRSKRIGCSRLTLNLSHILWDKNDLKLSFLQAVKAPVLTSAEEKNKKKQKMGALAVWQFSPAWASVFISLQAEPSSCTIGL